MKHVPTISFLIGLILGFVSIFILINFSIVPFLISLIIGTTIFNLYKKYFSPEDDFIEHFSMEELENAENKSEFFDTLFDEDKD